MSRIALSSSGSLRTVTGHESTDSLARIQSRALIRPRVSYLLSLGVEPKWIYIYTLESMIIR